MVIVHGMMDAEVTVAQCWFRMPEIEKMVYEWEVQNYSKHSHCKHAYSSSVLHIYSGDTDFYSIFSILSIVCFCCFEGGDVIVSKG